MIVYILEISKYRGAPWHEIYRERCGVYATQERAMAAAATMEREPITWSVVNDTFIVGSIPSGKHEWMISAAEVIG